MILGLGNRTQLRSFLLPGDLSARTATLVPDATVDALGLGIAGLFERHCTRKFGRVVDDTVTFEGERLSFVLPRYPVEQVSAVEFQAGFGAAWEAQVAANVLAGLQEASGLLQFAAMPTAAYGRVRVTYTGGYWVDDDEGDDEAPEGATALPEDLHLAWLYCAQEFWNKRDKLGLALTTAPDGQVAIARLEIPPAIKAMLAPHRRMQLS